MAMQTFLVVATRGEDAIMRAILELEPRAIYFIVKNDTWLVEYDGTAWELSDKLGIHSGANGDGIIVSASSFAGRGADVMWDWMMEYWHGE